MKNLGLFFVSLMIIIASCSDEKEEIKKEEKQAALKQIKGLVVDEAYFEKDVSNKKEASKSLEFAEILAGQTIKFVYEDIEISAKLNKSILGLKKAEKIYLKDGYIKSSGLKFKIYPAKIKKFPEFWTKEKLLPWIKKYPLTPVIILEDGAQYPLYYSLETFIQNAKEKDKIKILDRQTLMVEFKEEFYLFNEDYQLWKKRPDWDR